MRNNKKVNPKVVVDVVREMEKSINNEAILVKEAANSVGYTHLTQVETESILTRFVKLHSEFDKFQLYDPLKSESAQGLFTTGFVAINGIAGAIIADQGY